MTGLSIAAAGTAGLVTGATPPPVPGTGGGVGRAPGIRANPAPVVDHDFSRFSSPCRR